MSKAYFILVLHAHMPFVLDIRGNDSLEERWLFEALIDCYLRFVQMFDRLLTEGVPFRLGISLSPTLLAQLENPLLGDRFIKHLKHQIHLTENEVSRTGKIPEITPLARMYQEYYRYALEIFEKRCQCDLIQTFKSFQEQGVLEIMTCAATHPFLPLLKPIPTSIRAQITVAIKEYERIFECSPSGLWLPECGYFPGLDQILYHEGIRYTFLDTYVVQSSDPSPKYGTYAPIITPSGLIAFGRDLHSAKEVWSATDGYPGDLDYRDFYRDIGYDLELDYIRPYLPDGIRCFTGIKYHRIEKHEGENRLYEPERSAYKASIHADDFLAHRLKQIRDLALSMDTPPVICAFYDAELFGHWWFEGPQWLEKFFRKMAECAGYFEPITPTDFIQMNPKLQNTQPPGGSWGWKGYNEVWLNEKNRWVYPHLFKAGEKMEAMAQRDDWNALEEKILDQAGKELLLAQSSDWTFILHNETLTEYATKRIKQHLGRFWGLIHQLETNVIKEDWFREVEKQDCIFPSLSYRDFRKGS